MAKRNIIRIDEAKCNGCGECVRACAEGAIAIIDGKARLVSETYCDGLGACLGTCPQDAITVEEREAAEFDEVATEKHLREIRNPKHEIVNKSEFQKASNSKHGAAVVEKVAAMACGCPGTLAMSLQPKSAAGTAPAVGAASALSQWPVQLTLVSPTAPYFAGADLLLAADCVAFAMGDFHGRFLAGRKLVVGCPKLDDVEPYVDKLAAIIKHNGLASLTVVHMQVPCCSGLTRLAMRAIERAGVEMTFEDVTISLQGEVLSRQTIG
ncbi:MAG TPA: 4Fe-4S binding protein [Anaerohalosphaeraceae bacterium]|jgi:NAD-dependent dihydropyrimidine dehydrogenase PreA subunit|nr:4Fe-4S binding protein [Anaerohalosphaeraceae bacterium]HRT49589.1 4Fe-4S binding protein [Anaerohalosphaeraceae bacterium]HRT85476.1 4Fe-4S binding protein [Anaerohalosphaeraceae bacterium]